MTTVKQRKLARKVPEYLVKEVLDGIPIHYKGYRAVLRKEKTLEDIVGENGLQVFILSHFSYLLIRQLDEEQYYIFTGKIGFYHDKNNNLLGSVVVYEQNKLPMSKIDNHYLSLPPKIDIEIDVNIDTTDFSEQTYIYRKTDRLLSWGVEKVIWVLSESDRKSTRLNSSHVSQSRMPSSA